MDQTQLINAARSIKDSVDKAYQDLKLDDLKESSRRLEKTSSDKAFWDDQLKAQKVLKQLAKLKAKIEPWDELKIEVEETIELANLNDHHLLAELQSKLDLINEKYTKLKKDLKLNGEYDDYDAILNLYSGAGGTDAQDWTAMLLRMYLRWAEKFKYAVKIIDQNAGDEAGIKSVSLEVSGKFAYGMLKSENGVHRLVRLSPFNSDNLRQTSFAKVEVLPLIDKDNKVTIDEKDLRVDVYRSGGHGGQSVNTTDSAVRITHLPTNITVAIQNERSQIQNKELALTILRSKLLKLSLEQHTEKLNLLRGPNQSAEWGNQIRSYVLHPYKQVKDLRTGYVSVDVDKILDGDVQPLIDAYLEKII